jgi:hypothetical protein
VGLAARSAGVVPGHRTAVKRIYPMNDKLLRKSLNKLYETEKSLKRSKLNKWELEFVDSILYLSRWSPRQRTCALRILHQKGGWMAPER